MKRLTSIIPDPGRLITRDIPEQYLTDALGHLRGRASALVFPTSTREVSEILRCAHENRVPVTPRGAGTNLVGSTVPLEGGVILDLSRMNRILELDRDTFTVTVEAGVLLQDLQAYVEEEGLFYPPDPGEKASTIGGNISTNAGGMRAVKYGVTRDYVRGLEVVLADGTVLTLGSKNVKDASGLSLKHLVVGAEGTLAVITRCMLKVIPKPEASLSVLVPYPDLSTGISSVLTLLQADLGPTAVEFMEREVVALGEAFLNLRLPCPQAGSYILLTFDGRQAQVEASAARAREIALAHGALDYILLSDPKLCADVWKVRGSLVSAVEAHSQQEPVDIVVPINRSAQFIQFIHQVEQDSGVQMVGFGHAGDGNVHLCVVRGDREEGRWQEALHQVLDQAYAKAYALGGLTSGEHGVGASKRRYFLRQADGESLAVMNQIKDALDPLHILNGQKSYVTGGRRNAEAV